MTDTSQKFQKFDENKLRWSLLPWDTMQLVVKALEFGAKKYGDENWKKCEDTTRYSDAMLRHWRAHCGGEYLDTDSGLPHVILMVANVLFFATLEIGKGEKK